MWKLIFLFFPALSKLQVCTINLINFSSTELVKILFCLKTNRKTGWLSTPFKEVILLKFLLSYCHLSEGYYPYKLKNYVIFDDIPKFFYLTGDFGTARFCTKGGFDDKRFYSERSVLFLYIFHFLVKYGSEVCWSYVNWTDI